MALIVMVKFGDIARERHFAIDLPWVRNVTMEEEIPNSIEFSDSEVEDDLFLSQEANKIEGKYLRENVAVFEIGMEELMNSSTDSIESGCDMKFFESEDENLLVDEGISSTAVVENQEIQGDAVTFSENE